jgi:DNA-binding NtrC family response regulator
MSPSLLVVDDDAPLLELLRRYFEGRGWVVFEAGTGTGALERFGAERPDLVLLDLDLPDLNGLPVLQRLRELDDEVGVIMLTGHGDVEIAVEAMRAGAENFLTKPFELEHLAAVVDRTAEKVRLKRSNRFFVRASDPPPDADLGVSDLMVGIAGQVERIAAGDAPVLLLGETGTGKGWVARRIHDLSPRAQAPFVEVNCAGLSATFLESELFGHEQGAFTDARKPKDGLFDIADGGTVFLDEVGDLAPELQPKLLKVLETRRFRRLGGTRERTVDVRIVTATNHDIESAVAAGHFRQDLYYRLAVLPLELPPLRDRTPEDIVELTYGILRELHARIGVGPDKIADDALDRIVHYPWPGNIRELRNVIERILILRSDSNEIRVHHLPADMRGRIDPAPSNGDLTLQEVERRHIALTLDRNSGNRSRTARHLGISRATLYQKLDRYGLHTVGR